MVSLFFLEVAFQPCPPFMPQQIPPRIRWRANANHRSVAQKEVTSDPLPRGTCQKESVHGPGGICKGMQEGQSAGRNRKAADVIDFIFIEDAMWRDTAAPHFGTNRQEDCLWFSANHKMEVYVLSSSSVCLVMCCF